MESKLMPCPRELRHRTHGYCADYPRLFGIWMTMRSRCERPNRDKYADYGARGIRVCDAWQDAETFCKWAVENGYSDALQIDRINNNGNYEPSNCRWVSPKQNSRNRRNTVFVEIDGEIKCVSEWAEMLDISQYTIYWWVKKYGNKHAGYLIKERMSKNGSR